MHPQQQQRLNVFNADGDHANFVTERRRASFVALPSSAYDVGARQPYCDEFRGNSGGQFLAIDRARVASASYGNVSAIVYGDGGGTVYRQESSASMAGSLCLSGRGTPSRRLSRNGTLNYDLKGSASEQNIHNGIPPTASPTLTSTALFNALLRDHLAGARSSGQPAGGGRFPSRRGSYAAAPNPMVAAAAVMVEPMSGVGTLNSPTITMTTFPDNVVAESNAFDERFRQHNNIVHHHHQQHQQHQQQQQQQRRRYSNASTVVSSATSDQQQQHENHPSTKQSHNSDNNNHYVVPSSLNLSSGHHRPLPASQQHHSRAHNHQHNHNPTARDELPTKAAIGSKRRGSATATANEDSCRVTASDASVAYMTVGGKSSKQNSNAAVAAAVPSDSSATATNTHFFGFIHSGGGGGCYSDECGSTSSTSTIDDELTAYSSGFKRDDPALDRALGECNLIRSCGGGLMQGLLLRCMDNRPLYNFLHLALFKGGPLQHHHQQNMQNILNGGGVNSPSVSSSNTPPSTSSHSPAKKLSSAGFSNLTNGVTNPQQSGFSHAFTPLHFLIDELSAVNPKSQIGAYEELFTIQKSVASSILCEPGLSATRHSGYIVICFKIIDEHYKHSLEKSWLSWTGAREIYKYSPRTWNLRKITLHRHVSLGDDPLRTFAYVLLCEFGNILHPANTLQALDMCERLKVRNCGHIALYQVQYNYGAVQPQLMASPNGPSRVIYDDSGNVFSNQSSRSGSTHRPFSGGSTGSPTATTTTTSPSSTVHYTVNGVRRPPGHSSPQQQQSACSSRQNYRSGDQQQSNTQQQQSPWSSPKVTHRKISGGGGPNTTQPPSVGTSASSRRRDAMHRGYSQDVDSAHETLRRRTALLRMRDASLGGYDAAVPDDGYGGGSRMLDVGSAYGNCPFPPMSSSLYAASKMMMTSSAGSVVTAATSVVTPPRVPTPTTFSPYVYQHQ